jgi:hypothetical protein
MLSIVAALSLAALAGVALTAGACRLVLGVMPRRER